MSAGIVNAGKSAQGNKSEPLKFTVTGDRSLDELISSHLRSVTKDVLDSLGPEKVVALVLGGGYGRGEGGAARVRRGYEPYNDYDLVLVHRCDNATQLDKTLQRIQREHSARCGIHVDIMPLDFSKLNALPHTLTWYELQQGHKVLHGANDLLSSLGSRTVESLPDSEWGRLIFNRGSGLLYSIWLHQNKPSPVADDETFVKFATRQVEKAWLALGDTWLARRGAYDTKVVNRRSNWMACGDKVPEWSRYYLGAIDFKLSPVFERSNDELTRELALLAQLFQFELERYQCAESKPLVGLYSTIKYVRPALWTLSCPWRYPRERMRLALMAELGGNTLPRERLVGTTIEYSRLWQRFA